MLSKSGLLGRMETGKQSRKIQYIADRKNSQYEIWEVAPGHASIATRSNRVPCQPGPLLSSAFGTTMLSRTECFFTLATLTDLSASLSRQLTSCSAEMRNTNTTRTYMDTHCGPIGDDPWTAQVRAQHKAQACSNSNQPQP